MSAAAVLAGGIVLQAIALRNIDHGDTSKPRVAGLLENALPARISGWASHIEPLGPTEFDTTVAAEMLNFDDVFYRSYTQFDHSFTVYVAYWRSGRMPANRVAEHTPDVCWATAGWRPKSSRSDYVLECRTLSLIRGNWRIMSIGQSTRYVVFWHIVDGHAYSQPLLFGIVPSPTPFFWSAVRYALGAKQEQYFVRLASSVPFEELKNDPGFQQIVAALGKLGLEDRGGPKS